MYFKYKICWCYQSVNFSNFVKAILDFPYCSCIVITLNLHCFSFGFSLMFLFLIPPSIIIAVPTFPVALVVALSGIALNFLLLLTKGNRKMKSYHFCYQKIRKVITIYEAKIAIFQFDSAPKSFLTLGSPIYFRPQWNNKKINMERQSFLWDVEEHMFLISKLLIRIV